MHFTVYTHKNFCNQGDVVVAHPQGLPPGWREHDQTIIPADRELEAAVTAKLVEAGCIRKIHDGACLSRLGCVVHLKAGTLELINSYTLR